MQQHYTSTSPQSFMIVLNVGVVVLNDDPMQNSSFQHFGHYEVILGFVQIHCWSM